MAEKNLDGRRSNNKKIIGGVTIDCHLRKMAA